MWRHKLTAREQVRAIALGIPGARAANVTTPILTRPLLTLRAQRWTPILAGLSAGVPIALGVFFGLSTLSERPTTVVVQPATVEAAAVEAAAVEAEPEEEGGEDEDEGEAAHAAPPRALTPHLNSCLLRHLGHDESPCNWDDGFPAISGDGTTIAMKSIEPRAGNRGQDIEIHFLDARTGHVQRRAPILSESDAGTATQADLAAGAKRLEAVQRTLDARKFRAMIAPTFWDANNEELPTHATAGEIYAQEDEGLVRLIDPQTNTVIIQGQIGALPPSASVESGCSGGPMASFAAWWDPSTKTLLDESRYLSPGGSCGQVVVRHVTRAPL